ncbi:MAG: hypothetical protein KGI40_03355, partial [Xanthomonadaceae bacterium]|nr:hypothetical protein [Xanthomonadaceae bacterium]
QRIEQIYEYTENRIHRPGRDGVIRDVTRDALKRISRRQTPGQEGRAGTTHQGRFAGRPAPPKDRADL